MKINNFTDELEVPHGVSVRVEGLFIVVKGKLGELRRRLIEPGIEMKAEGSLVKIHIPKFTKKEKTKVGTIIAHMKNMFKGVTEGHVYKLKICSGHFPMNVSLANNRLVVKNFMGEKIPRTVTIDPDIKVKMEGQIISVEGISKELAGQTAAEFEHLTRRSNYDRRVFQDGVYIIEKDGKPVRA